MSNETQGTPRDENGAIPSTDPHAQSGYQQSGYQQSGYPQPGYAQAPGQPTQGYDSTAAYGDQSYGGAPGYGTPEGQGSASYGTPGQPTGTNTNAQGWNGQQQSYGAAPYSGNPYNTNAYGQPGYGAATGGYPQGYGAPVLTPASWGRRALGWLVDWFVGGAVLSILSTLIFHPYRVTYNTDGTAQHVSYGTSTLPSLISFAILATIVGLLTRNGQAPGNRLAKTQILDENGRPVSGGKAILRNLAHYIDSLICMIGWLFPLWDAKRQTIADKIMKTTVVDVSQTGPIS